MTTETVHIQTTEGQRRLKARGVHPVPQPDDLTRPYWSAARRNELVVQRCQDCEQYQHPPAPACSTCNSLDLRWTRVSGRGFIYSFIVDHRLMVPGFNEPYVVAQVVPEEAQRDTVRITTNIVGCPADQVSIGMKVSVVFMDLSPTVTLPQFTPLRKGRDG